MNNCERDNLLSMDLRKFKSLFGIIYIMYIFIQLINIHFSAKVAP